MSAAIDPPPIILPQGERADSQLPASPSFAAAPNVIGIAGAIHRRYNTLAEAHRALDEYQSREAELLATQFAGMHVGNLPAGLVPVPEPAPPPPAAPPAAAPAALPAALPAAPQEPEPATPVAIPQAAEPADADSAQSSPGSIVGFMALPSIPPVVQTSSGYRYYAVARGRQVGIFDQPWSLVRHLVEDYPHATHRLFRTIEEASDWHRTARCEYQKEYYTLKKSGRRKVSKQARADAEEKRALEQSGLRFRYSFDLVHSSSTPDPSRTEEMREEEHRTWDRCYDLAAHLKHAHGEDWPSPYIAELQDWIDELLSKALDIKRTSSQSAVHVHDELHLHRRVIAGLAQEQQLAELHPEATVSAAEDWALIWYGRRVNRTAFRKRYGW
ncbi:hypothetical protein BV25DRAFT_1922108 [Artomyces pyxidatus]|uniref:Uncharacterized protein n=1 Tax=Artomyces pyxidatus TaxID=48021 RepID=A0ACB8SEU4_9AGAM|nr:hypothetical protein BV25DRAFT_1922108 [Artomyces pyxidatus]